jgi:hypothetical protein
VKQYDNETLIHEQFNKEQLPLLPEVHCRFLGFMKGGWYGDTDGQVADTGVQRQLKEQDIEKARSMAG